MTKGWVYNHCTIFTRFKSNQEKNSFVDPKQIISDSDPDPDPTFQSITDPDPDPTSRSFRIRIRIQVRQKFRIRADPDPDPQHCGEERLFSNWLAQHNSYGKIREL